MKIQYLYGDTIKFFTNIIAVVLEPEKGILKATLKDGSPLTFSLSKIMMMMDDTYYDRRKKKR